MSELENLIRDSMRRSEHQAPGPTTLLAQVRRKEHARRQRIQLASVGGTVVAVVAVVLAAGPVGHLAGTSTIQPGVTVRPPGAASGSQNSAPVQPSPVTSAPVAASTTVAAIATTSTPAAVDTTSAPASPDPTPAVATSSTAATVVLPRLTPQLLLPLAGWPVGGYWKDVPWSTTVRLVDPRTSSNIDFRCQRTALIDKAAVDALEQTYSDHADSGRQAQEHVEVASSVEAAQADLARLGSWLSGCTAGMPNGLGPATFTKVTVTGQPTETSMWGNSNQGGLPEVTAFGRVGRAVVVVDLTTQGGVPGTQAYAAVAATLTAAMSRLAAGGF
ncbi:MAG: hypothetical protein QOE76_801 [Frankiales bacterium]|nr:hypothetical protein [Frankiales bacterium]